MRVSDERLEARAPVFTDFMARAVPGGKPLRPAERVFVEPRGTSFLDASATA